MDQLPVPWEDVRQALEVLRDLAPDPDLTVSKYIEGVTQAFKPAWSLLYPGLQHQVYIGLCTIHHHILTERKRRKEGKNLLQFGILQDDLPSLEALIDDIDQNQSNVVPLPRYLLELMFVKISSIIPGGLETARNGYKLWCVEIRTSPIYEKWTNLSPIQQRRVRNEALRTLPEEIQRCVDERHGWTYIQSRLPTPQALSSLANQFTLREYNSFHDVQSFLAALRWANRPVSTPRLEPVSQDALRHQLDVIVLRYLETKFHDAARDWRRRVEESEMYRLWSDLSTVNQHAIYKLLTITRNALDKVTRQKVQLGESWPDLAYMEAAVKHLHVHNPHYAQPRHYRNDSHHPFSATLDPNLQFQVGFDTLQPEIPTHLRHSSHSAYDPHSQFVAYPTCSSHFDDLEPHSSHPTEVEPP